VSRIGFIGLGPDWPQVDEVVLGPRGVFGTVRAVSGGEAGAIAGKLSIMVGGEPDDFEAARGVFEAVGATITGYGSQDHSALLKVIESLAGPDRAGTDEV